MTVQSNGTVRREIRTESLPVRVVASHQVTEPENLLNEKPCALAFHCDGFTRFEGAGSWVLLDFGRELCGGIRMLTRSAELPSIWRLTFGESVMEALSSIDEKNATNHHAMRDFTVEAPNMSDQTFGQTGFRFVKVELKSERFTVVQSILAASVLPDFAREGSIVTSDPLLNDILETAAYTLKLCMQNDFVWDGIKRDRVVWCGDLHPELLTSLYRFGRTPNMDNALAFLAESTPADTWMNTIPSYSAWWVINLCDMIAFTGDRTLLDTYGDYARRVIAHIASYVQENGDFDFGLERSYFLDWSTADHSEAQAGVAAQFMMMAEKFLGLEENADCRLLLARLARYTAGETTLKPVRAFQILVGRCEADDTAMLEAGGARGFSTFMAYYILTALAKAGGTEMLPLIKEYYGGMLSRGATSFWEDFDVDWLENSGRIDELTPEGVRDIHGDFGKHCYQQFRHSLCHGWSSGVYAFIAEYIVGVRITDGGKQVTVSPHPLGLSRIEATFPLPQGDLTVKIVDGVAAVVAPEGVAVEIL